MNQIDWNRSLLLGSLLIMTGVMAVVAGRSSRDRIFALGVLVQGIAIIYAIGGSHFSRMEFDLSGGALLVMYCLLGAWMIPRDRESNTVMTPETPLRPDESKVPQ